MSIVKGRLQQDDFVIDDGVGGYMDNGMDDWTGGDANEIKSEDEPENKKKGTLHTHDTMLYSGPHVVKKKTKDDAARGKAKARALPPPVPSISAYRPAVSAEQEADFMSSILGTMDMLPSAPTVSRMSRKRKPSPQYEAQSSSPAPLPSSSYHSKSSPYDYTDGSSDGPLDDITGIPSSDDILMSPKKKVKVNGSGMTPAIERMAHLDVHSDNDGSFDNSFDDMDMDAFMDVDDDELKKPIVKKEVIGHGNLPMKTDLGFEAKPYQMANGISLKKKELDVPSWLSVYDSLSIAPDDSLGPLSASSSAVTSHKIAALEPDGSLRFYWLDYLEHEGKIYFIGKLKDKMSGSWVSCCVTIEGLQRNLFVLPREKRVEEDEGQLYDTDIIPEMKDVYNDFDRIRQKVGIKAWKARFVKRKYAFGETDVPREETQWLKVVYGFDGKLSFSLSLM
jgi:DNA polymerase alpha subunit A